METERGDYGQICVAVNIFHKEGFFSPVSEKSCRTQHRSRTRVVSTRAFCQNQCLPKYMAKSTLYNLISKCLVRNPTSMSQTQEVVESPKCSCKSYLISHRIVCVCLLLLMLLLLLLLLLYCMFIKSFKRWAEEV